jgi:hypothetical protein
VILFVVESLESTRNELDISQPVIDLFKQVANKGCRSAFECGVPLVQIRPQILGSMQKGLSGSVVSAMKYVKPSQSLFMLNYTALALSQKCIAIEPTLAKLWFDVQDDQIDFLADIPLSRVWTLAQTSNNLLKLRIGSDRLRWKRLMIGEDIYDANAQTISHNTAFLALGGSLHGDCHDIN